MKRIINKVFSYQGIRFLFVGGLNTIVGYGIYALLLYLNVNYLLANTISTIIGVAHSYLWNKYFTFKSKEKALKEITKFVSVYIVSYLLGMITLYLFKEKLNISPYIAGLINLVITTLISYFGHKYISFKNNNQELKQIKEKLKDYFYNINSIPTSINWVVLIIIILVCFLFFNHGDITATATHGKDLLVATLDGKFFSFYDYTKSTAVYLIPLYILFALWSIPVLIIYKVFNIPVWGVLDYGAIKSILLLWYKLLPTIFTVLTSVVLVKIVKEIGIKKEKQKWIKYLFFSCPILIFSQFVFGQYDAFCMFFTTLAFYYYIKKDYYKFSIIMSIAITLKFFPLLIFIPLILLVEKNVIRIAKHLLIGLAGTVISNLLFITSPGFSDAKEFTSNMFDKFFNVTIPTPYGFISLFIVLFIGICIYAYTKKINDKFEFIHTSIYISLTVYSALFMFISWHPQWVILLVPFLILSLLTTNNIKVSLILFLVTSSMYIIISAVNFPKNVDEILINGGILQAVFNNTIPARGLLGGFFMKFNPMSKNIFMTLFVSSLLYNNYLNVPTNKNIDEFKKRIKDKNIGVERGYLLSQVLPIFIYIIPTLYLYFVYYK